MTNDKIAKEEAILAKRKKQARNAKDGEKQQKRKLARLPRGHCQHRGLEQRSTDDESQVAD